MLARAILFCHLALLCLLSLFSLLAFSCASLQSPRHPATDGTQPPKYTIDVTGTSPVDLATITPIIEQVIAEFESKVAPLKSAIKVSIGSPNCLRVGYSFTNGDVEFCDSKNVINEGLSSHDVIRHETFHAMVCNVRPEICTSDVLKNNIVVASHEALADYFAYQFEPDSCFGENFYSNQTCVRQYSTSLCYSLVDGPHEKGNALESLLISSHVTLSQAASAILNSDFTASGLLQAVNLPVSSCFAASGAPQLTATVSGYPTSQLNKYWIHSTQPLLIQFQPNATMQSAYPNAVVQWNKEDGTPSTSFNVVCQSPLSFSVTPKAASGIEKLIAQILNGKDVVGDIPFYFGIKPSP
jgi:hypothetical protein